MKIKKLLATAILAIAATATTTVTANGQAGVASDVTVGANAGPVAYTTALAADHTSALVRLASSRFTLGRDAVTVTADDGTIVGTIPTTLQARTGQTFNLTPTLDNTGTELTLTPASAPVPGLHQAQGNFAVVEVGEMIGCVIGILIGIWFFLVGAIIGCAVGAIIGQFLA
ncbi:hypothetical protein [Nocardia pseudovaccinii]|uniref:hypothetical protein n=1 Tax=Nocardia pseudovaccinii TaxID=189540 RepID=UPI0007A3D7DD|nr:hypothetical protein [Nocardia pseudovaccinii]